MKQHGTLTFTLILAAWLPVASVQAASMLQPAAASSDIESTNFPPDRAIDQSGLSAPYTSLATDLNTYIASNPTHDSDNPDNFWLSLDGDSTGNFDFDLGGSHVIESFVLWNIGDEDFVRTWNVVGFTLLAAGSADFSGAVSLGSFTADPNTGPSTAVLPEVFSFTPTTASYVRMQITSNNGGNNVAFGEAAFGVRGETIIPIPSAALAGLIGLGLAGLRRSR